MAGTVDKALWTIRPRFGVAGGAHEHALTDEGNARAFAIGAGVRQGPAAKALELLASLGGEGKLLEKSGSSFRITQLGRFDQVAWSYLRGQGLVESVGTDGVRLTRAGERAVERGHGERDSLLGRVRKNHPLEGT